MISKSLKTFKFIFSNLRHSQTSLFLSVRIYTSNQPIEASKEISVHICMHRTFY